MRRLELYIAQINMDFFKAEDNEKRENFSADLLEQHKAREKIQKL
jgi:hypothetical protein